MADFVEVALEKVGQIIEKINTTLQGKVVSRKVKQKFSYAKKLKKYHQKEQVLGKEIAIPKQIRMLLS